MIMTFCACFIFRAENWRVSSKAVKNIKALKIFGSPISVAEVNIIRH